jgi:hypothetical protein
MAVVHPELPVAVRVECEPELANEEFKHRAERPGRFQHQPGVGERVRGPEETALAAG